MSGIGWSADLETGAETVDAEHRGLVQLLAEANGHFNAGDVRAAVRLLRRFLGEFGSHFAAEQRRLAQADPEAAAVRDREYRTSHFIFAAHPLEADEVEVIGQLLAYANAWLTDHIVRQDAPFKSQASAVSSPGRRRWRPRFDILKLRWRIALLALVPLCALGALVVASFAELERNASAMRLMARMNELNGQVGDVIHELQRERGLATLLLHDRRLGRDQLERQYKITDQASEALRVAVQRIQGDLPDSATRGRLDGALLSLELIEEVRDDLNTGSFDAVETMDFYTTAIEDLAAVVPEVVRSVLPSDFAKLTFAQVFLQQAKERAGHERTAGVAILSAATPEWSLSSVRDMAAEQRALGEGFVALAPIDLANAYRAAQRETEGPMTWMRNALDSRELTKLSAQEWFDISSRHIDALREVETQLSWRLTVEAKRLERQTDRRFAVLAGGMALLVLVSLAMVLGLGWTILPPLVRLAEAVRRLADGERAVAIPGLAARDELGAVARFVQQLKERLVHSDLLEARRMTANAERLRVVADNTPGIVFRIFQADGGRAVMVCASRKLRDIVGLSPADVVDVPVRRLVRPMEWSGLLRMLRRSEPSPLSFEFQLRRSQPGAPRWLRVVVSPSPTEGGWLWDGVALDVSGLKAAERERGRIAAEVGRLTAPAGDGVPSARSLAAKVASALGPIAAQAERARQAVPQDAAAQDALELILAETRRLEALVKEVLPADAPEAPFGARVIPFKGKP